MSFRFVLSLAILLTACGDEGSALSVDLRTDFVPGIELGEVDVTLLSDDALDRVESFAVRPDARLLSGVRVARFEELTPGSYTLRVRLFGAAGERLLERRVNVTVRGETVTTVPVTRACLNVTCEDAGASECLNGMCVPPGCTEETPDLCGSTLCTSPSECPASTTACAVAACTDGACFVAPVENACESGQVCVPEMGCVVAPSGADAGRDASDDVGRDAEVEVGTDASTCDEGVPCDTGNACETGRTDCSSGSAACVSAGFRDATFVCRAAASECDVAETCTGTTASCPDDTLATTGTPCASGFCNAGSCGSCEPGVACPTGNLCEVGIVDCASGSPVCVRDRFRDSGFTCRPSAGMCDVAETCTGSSAGCPADAFASGGVCRAATGTCDVAESCNGSSAACPSEAVRPNGYECRAEAAGGCDVAETCDGASKNCPTNGFLPSSATCRASAGTCDVAEMCTGSSAGCPANVFRSSSFVCRIGGACNPSESCSGSSASCPPDAVATAGTSCGPATCGGYGACSGANCGFNRGFQSRTCTPQECNGSGTCVSGAPQMEMQACTLPVGASCGVCGGTGCGGLLAICDGVCDSSGCCDDGF